jgi:hypothetical protein
VKKFTSGIFKDRSIQSPPRIEAALPRHFFLFWHLEDSLMSLRAVAVCVVLASLVGCDTGERSTAVKHQSGWQRQAGESPQAAAQIAQQMDKNTQDLQKAIQSGKSEDLMLMHGKLVSMDGQVAEQHDGSWTIKCDDGWTVVAQVNDLTPNSSTSRDNIDKCGCCGIVQKIDATNKQIVLADVDLAPTMKNPMAANVATK